MSDIRVNDLEEVQSGSRLEYIYKAQTEATKSMLTYVDPRCLQVIQGGVLSCGSLPVYLVSKLAQVKVRREEGPGVMQERCS